MWTNVFRVGGFQQVSWFQFLPSESDGGTLHDRSVNIEEQSDTSTSVVLSAHVKLQNEGYLSTWTNSFVGPWDPSQGIHNPDEKIKLWLFLPGRVSSITTNAQAAVQGLKVVASGFWRCPGDSEEIGIAFSQALRNRIDRAFRGLSYVRFGDVFVKYRSFGQADVHFRRPLFTCEFIFSVSEEALFIHVTVSSKRVRLLSCDDIEGVLRKQSQNAKEFPSVIVAPHGMRGKLTGCCPTDLASQLYQSKLKSPNGSVLASLPSHLTYTSNGNIRGKAYYAEVSLGCLAGRPGIWEQSSTENIRVKPEANDNGSARSQATNEKNASQEGYVQLIERTFIYPPEAVLVPLIPLLPARTCLKRCWLRDMAGTTWLESVSQTDMALTKFSMTKPILGNTVSKDSLPGSNSLLRQNSGISDSSSSSTTSSRGSASSTDTDTEQGVNTGEIDADGDSVISKHSQLTSPRDAGNPNSILAGKRGHSNGAESVSEAVTSKKARTVENTVQDTSGVSPELYANDTGKSGCTLKESSMAGGPSIASIFNKESWDWPDGDQAIGIEDLEEFDDFGDFFEDDPLSFGEPPGSAESHGFIFNTANVGDGMAGLDTRSMDLGEQLLLPVFDFQSLDGFGEQPETTKTDIASNTEGYKDSKSSQAVSQISGESAIEVDSLPKSEAIYMFAPEYTPIQMPKNEFSSSLFKRPYIPKSRRLQNRESHSKIYHYSATPPPSPRRNVSGYSRKTRDEIRASNDSDIHTELKKLYTHALSAKKFSDNSCSSHSYSSVTQRRDSSFPGTFSVKIASSTQSKRAEGGLGNGGFLKFPRTVLATEIECAMFQAAMCRIRHMLLTSNNVIVFGSNKLNVDLLPCQLPDTSSHETNMTFAEDSMQEQKKKDTIPVRIAGDVDGKIHEEPLTSQVGVWRSVGAPKPQKTFSSFGSENVRNSIHIKSEDEKSLSNTQQHITTGNNNENAGAPYSKMEETTVTGKSKQPLHELLDAMPMLVQQATSSSDICFDGDCGDGPFGWLAVQEQQRRRFSCGPAMVHAGCGGSLSACHSLDASGVELTDPLFSDVTPAAVANLLYSDVRMALKSAFGDSNLDGPLLLIEWCKGRANTGEVGHSVEAYSGEGGPNDSKESASTVTAVGGEPITPPQCSVVSSVSFKVQNIQQSDIQMCEVQRGNKSWSVDNFSVSESTRIDDAGHKRVPQDLETESRNKPTLLGLPVPSLLVGYQDDWLKTSSATLQLWEKAPFEPYARPKPVSYCVVCPNIDPLLSASVDFLLQLGSVYESCKLGTHTSMNTGGFTSLSSGRWASSGIVPFECTQLQKKVQNLSFISSINEYLVAIENGVEVYDFCKSLSETLRNLPMFGNVPGQRKEVESGSSLVIYVICPFMEPSAVLQTVIAACSSVGVARSSSDKGKNQINYNYIERMQDFASASDETLSVPTLFGFNIPKLVLQVLTADMILRITRPPVTELVLLKEVAFTVYNKVRRIPRANYNHEMVQATSSFPKPRPGNMHMGPAVSGRWKDCNTTRVNSGTLPLSRDTLIDGGCLRPASWDNSWQAAKHGESILCESSIHGESPFVEDVRYLFEPLFILAEPGTLDQGISLVTTSSLESMKSAPDDTSRSNQPSSSSILGETGGNNATEASESDFGGRNQKVANLHCCYGWTEDWQWLVCVWTDARGELLDVHIFPFGGISGRQDTKGLESLFVQVLQQGCQLLSLNPEIGASKLRSIVIAKIGCFYELECQEWQKAILAVGGHEVKKWPMQMRHFSPDGTSSSAGGGTLQQQDIGLIQDRTLPSSPSPIYSTHSKASAFMKGSVGQVNARKQSLSVNSQDGPKGAFQGVHSISLVALCMDHSLQLICPSEIIPQGGSQGTSLGLSSFIEGLNSLKSLASTSVTNLLVPSHGLRFLPPAPLQLPICLTAESPPLAHLLHSKGYAAPLATSFAVSKATPSLRKNSTQQGMGAEWPSTLMVSLIDYYGASTILPSGQQSSVASEPMIKGKHTRASVSEGKDYQADCNSILEALAVEIHALSWLTVSPSFLERRTALPLHCDMVQRLQRLIYFAHKEFYSTNSLKRVLP